MDPAAWLEKTAPGYDLLSDPERKAMKDFSLLWTLYEGTVLHASGNAGAIVGAVDHLKSSGRLSLDPFRPAIEHFSGRYFDGTDMTDAFRGLHLRPNDRRELVENVLRGQSSDEAEILTALLIIVFRLRNNLFHGIKWSYGIKDQLENFTNANAVLMAAMEMHQR